MQQPLADDKALGRAIRELRLDHGLSQEGLAAEVGMHRNAIGYVERAETSLTFSNLVKIAAVLDVNASELVARAELQSG